MYRLVEMPVDAITDDNEAFPERDQSYILDHLEHYCSKFDQLPAIQIRVEPGRVVVTDRHRYLRVARRLGRSRISAVIEPTSDASATRELLARRDVSELVPTPSCARRMELEPAKGGSCSSLSTPSRAERREFLKRRSFSRWSL